MKKTTCCTAILLAMMLGITGCGGDTDKGLWERMQDEYDEGNTDEKDGAGSSDENVEVSQEIITYENIDPAVEPPELADQYRCIAAHKEEWFSPAKNYSAVPMYTVTDLDHNGRLEVIFSVCEGSGMYSTSRIWQVDSDAQSLIPVSYGVEEGDSEPDLIYDTVTHYYNDEKDYYLFTDVVRISAAESVFNRYVLSLHRGVAEIELISTSHQVYDDAGLSEEIYYDGKGKEISPEEYGDLEKTLFAGCQQENCYLNWVGLEEDDDAEAFAAAAYQYFLDPESGGFEKKTDYRIRLYTNPRSKNYKALKGKKTVLKGMDSGKIKIRFKASEDNVQVALEYGEWVNSLNYFRPIMDVFNITTEKGKIYQFPATLSEGRPEYRIRASKAGQTTFWYLQEDGRGEGNGVVRLIYRKPKLTLPKKDSSIMTLCQVYAGMLVNAGTEEAMRKKYYWKTAGNAVMLQTLRTDDTDAEGKVYLTDWHMNAYLEALFPNTTKEPKMVDSDPVSYEPDRYEHYIVEGGVYYDDSTTNIVSIEKGENDTVKVLVEVLTETGYEGVVVYLQQDMDSEQENPFGYSIYYAEISEG